MSEFTGFPEETVEFLSALSANNSKAWFDAHRDDYDRYWLAPARAFVPVAGEALQALAPDVRAEPRVNGSIFRVNRDIRFSKDKRPYKDHLDFWFWEGERSAAVSGFFLRITPAVLHVGVGSHGFDRDRLEAYRRAVADTASAAALEAAVSEVERAGYPVEGEHYRRVPRGFEPATPFQERLLRYGALWAGDEGPIPASVHSRRLVSYAMTRWTKLAPLHRWLVATLS